MFLARREWFLVMFFFFVLFVWHFVVNSLSLLIFVHRHFTWNRGMEVIDVLIKCFLLLLVVLLSSLRNMSFSIISLMRLNLCGRCRYLCGCCCCLFVVVPKLSHVICPESH